MGGYEVKFTFMGVREDKNEDSSRWMGAVADDMAVLVLVRRRDLAEPRHVLYPTVSPLRSWIEESSTASRLESSALGGLNFISQWNFPIFCLYVVTHTRRIVHLSPGRGSALVTGSGRNFRS